MSDQWFSAQMRILCLVEGHGATTQMDVVHIFRSAVSATSERWGDDWDAAIARAIELGRTHEDEYLNGDGATVRWRLEKVLTVDMIRVEDLDGAEVHSQFGPAPEVVAFDAEFHPEAHRPGNTGI